MISINMNKAEFLIILSLLAYIGACAPQYEKYTLSTKIHLTNNYTVNVSAEFLFDKKSGVNEMTQKAIRIKQALTMSLRQIDPENIHMMNKLRVGFALEKICDQILRSEVRRVRVTLFDLKKRNSD